MLSLSKHEGWPRALGEAFVAGLERALGRTLRPAKRGRRPGQERGTIKSNVSPNFHMFL